MNELKFLHGWESKLASRLDCGMAILPVIGQAELATLLYGGYAYFLIDDGHQVEIVRATTFGREVKIERGVGGSMPKSFHAGACVKWVIVAEVLRDVQPAYEKGQSCHKPESCEQPRHCGCHSCHDVNPLTGLQNNAVRMIAPIDLRVNIVGLEGLGGVIGDLVKVILGHGCPGGTNGQNNGNPHNEAANGAVYVKGEALEMEEKPIGEIQPVNNGTGNNANGQPENDGGNKGEDKPPFVGLIGSMQPSTSTSNNTVGQPVDNNLNQPKPPKNIDGIPIVYRDR